MNERLEGNNKEYSALEITDAVIRLAELALRFSRVERATYHPDGLRRETDSDHTVMLSLIGCAIATEIRPDLDVGRIAQFCLVHDLVEAYAGDTATLVIDQQGLDDKELREQAALQRLHREFDDTLPWLTETIEAYESRLTPEARFVKVLDKLMPKITHIFNGGVYLHQIGMSKDQLLAFYEAQPAAIASYAFDQPELMLLRELLTVQMIADVYPEDLPE